MRRQLFKLAIVLGICLQFVFGLSNLAAQAAGSNSQTTGLTVLDTSLVDGATVVRPDVQPWLVLDRTSPRYQEVQQWLDHGKYGVRLEYQNKVVWLLPNSDFATNLAAKQASEPGPEFRLGKAKFDSSTGKITYDPGMLDRYTWYTVTLAVGDDLERLVRGTPGQGTPVPLEELHHSYMYRFETGSAIGEPTHLAITSPNTHPRVTEGGLVIATVTDDYGDPATMGGVQTQGATLSGAPLDPSFAAPEVNFSETLQGNQVAIPITYHKAEPVLVTVSTSGPWPEDFHSSTITFYFRPGLPAHITLVAPADTVVGLESPIDGVVTDIYGNNVEDGSVMLLEVTEGAITNSVTTVGGVYTATFTAPTKLMGTPGQPDVVRLTVYSAEGTAQISSEIRVHAGLPAQTTLVAPATVQVGEEVPVSGLVADVYGNAVEDGSVVLLNTTEGAITSPITTMGGAYQGTFKAPTMLTGTPGLGDTVNVTLASDQGSAQASVKIQVNPGPAASVALNLSANTMPADGKSQVTLNGTVKDLYGNAVLDGTPITLTNSGVPVTFSPTPVVTKGGTFTVAVTAGTTAGTATVTAANGKAQSSVTITLTGSSFKVGSITGWANPWSIPANGTSSSVVYFLVKDIDGKLAPDHTEITFGLSGGGTISAKRGETINGLATVTYTAGTEPGTIRVTGTVDSLTLPIPINLVIQTTPLQLQRVSSFENRTVYITNSGAVYAVGNPSAREFSLPEGGGLSNASTPANNAASINSGDTTTTVFTANTVYTINAEDGTVHAVNTSDPANIDGTTTTGDPTNTGDTTNLGAGGLGQAPDRIAQTNGTDPGTTGDPGTGAVEGDTPVRVMGISGAISVATGRDGVTLALKDDGTVWRWGGSFGSTPTQIPGLSNIVSVTANTSFFAITGSGQVYAWGSNNMGQLGLGDMTDRSVPTLNPYLSNVKQMSAGLLHTLAVTYDGTVYAWGAVSQRYGWLFNKGQTGNWSGSLTPQVVFHGGVMVATGYRSSAVLANDGTVWTIGYYVGLGRPFWYSDGTTVWGRVVGPWYVDPLQGVVRIAGANVEDRFEAITYTGQTASWGFNGDGEFGIGVADGSYTYRAAANFNNLTNVVDTASGEYHTVWLTTNGTLYGAGSNSEHQLGLPGWRYTSPVQIPTAP